MERICGKAYLVDLLIAIGCTRLQIATDCHCFESDCRRTPLTAIATGLAPACNSLLALLRMPTTCNCPLVGSTALPYSEMFSASCAHRKDGSSYSRLRLPPYCLSRTGVGSATVPVSSCSGSRLRVAPHRQLSYQVSDAWDDMSQLSRHIIAQSLQND